MKKYESVIILKPKLKNEELKEVLNNIDKVIEKVANIEERKDLGLKKLAYDVKGEKEGYYIVHLFNTKDEHDLDGVASIEKYFRTQEEIIKFIVIERE